MPRTRFLISMTVTLGLNMRLISSLSSNMFRRRISIHGLFRLYKQETSPLSIYCAAMVDVGRSHYMTTWHAQRNRPCIEILLQNVFEDNDEIRRIFGPRVTVIEIRKRVRACIRRR
ncbi:hypothetical protein SFRURICE_019734, partial [Spodoptera frugiperda]